MIKSYLLIPVFFISLLSVLTAQESPGKHSVDSIIFVIDGDTRENAIRRFVDIKEGDVFESFDEMMRIAEREKQDLVNYRVFKYVTMDVDEIRNEDDSYGWRITYGVQDSWTLLPIPYPKYDTNRGFRIGLKTYYDNAFGTMTDAYLGMGMNLRKNDDTGKIEVGEWNINPAWRRIKLGSLYFSVDLSQAYSEETYSGGLPSENYAYSYYQSTFSFGSTIEFEPTDWSYSFRPTFFFRYGYEDDLGNDNYREEPFNFSWYHNGGWGRVDWLGNFRTGQNYTLGNSIRVVLDPDKNDYFVITDFDLTAAYYLPIGNNFNYYGRSVAFTSLNGRRSAVGGLLRGIEDDSMSGKYGFVLNTTMGMRFWRLEGVWDAQIHPFFDIGTVIPEDGFNPGTDIRYGAGFDLVLYVDAVPNLVARMTLGVDLGRHDWNNWDKYELIITSSLFY